MKIFTLLFFMIVAKSTYASAMINCPLGQFRVQTPQGIMCVSNYPAINNDCVYCQTYMTQQYGIRPTWFNQFPSALYQTQNYPWWATQGQLHYPNMFYPGAWNYQHNRMNPNYYPGHGSVFAAKPNVYIESIHKSAKFEFEFTDKDSQFLITTPLLSRDFKWKGKISNLDRFQVDEINYDYLFYDLRLPKEKMQFEAGVCTSRKEVITWMLQDLKELNYPTIALQDFEEHWNVKIPDLPFYCVYPQYNEQLDQSVPVKITLEQVHFTRALYVLVGHDKEPSTESSNVPLPHSDSRKSHPSTKIKYENMFKEWGVAFLAD